MIDKEKQRIQNQNIENLLLELNYKPDITFEGKYLKVNNIEIFNDDNYIHINKNDKWTLIHKRFINIIKKEILRLENEN